MRHPILCPEFDLIKLNYVLANLLVRNINELRYPLPKKVTAIEQSEHDLHRDREYHKITHEEVHPNLNGGPPIRKRITHGYKRPAPHVQGWSTWT